MQNNKIVKANTKKKALANKTNETILKTTKTKNIEVLEKKENLTKINLSKFKNELEKKVLENTKKDKQLLYIYPDELNTKEKINSLLGKKFRQNTRNKLERFSNNIFIYAKTENIESLKKEIEDFKIFYKERFVKNDFTKESLSSSTKNESDLTLMLNIINEINK